LEEVVMSERRVSPISRSVRSPTRDRCRARAVLMDDLKKGYDLEKGLRVKEQVFSISWSLCARRLEIVVVRARLLVMKEGEGFLWRRTCDIWEVTPLGSEFTADARVPRSGFLKLSLWLLTRISHLGVYHNLSESSLDILEAIYDPQIQLRPPASSVWDPAALLTRRAALGIFILRFGYQR